MKKRLLIGVVVVAVSALFFAFTDPENLPIGLLMIPILLAFAVVTSVTYLFIHWFRLFHKSRRKQRGVAVLCGVMAAFYLVFQSTGGIVLGDAILLALIFTISYIYVSKY